MAKKPSVILIKIGLGTCGIAAGGQQVFDEFAKELDGRTDVRLDYTSCDGTCYREPIVEVIYPNDSHRLLTNVTVKQVKTILDSLDKTGDEDKATPQVHESQTRIVLENCGIINPDNIDEYIANGGYHALKNIVLSITPEHVIADIKQSGLRGRGGAGFLTGQKWDFARQPKAEQKYVICNADEGDPGAFMDRAVLEGDPHRVLEGLIISGYAIGASIGYVYIRAEYPLAIKRLRCAIHAAESKGFLGDSVCDSSFSFTIKIKEGAGAFVCGEETALIASIEGKRGMPRLKPPFPAVSGLWGAPTNINNVETLACIPWIMRRGAAEYAKLGTEKSKGTKVFSLAGKVAKGGLVEVELGMPLRKIIEDIGGGTSSGKPFKAVQMGGPSGGCVPANLLDIPVDFESLAATGAIMGSGGMIVLDEATCMVDMARYFLSFIQKESCGKCTFCRIGTKRMLEILERITAGKGAMSDLDALKALADKITVASLCALGKTAPNPVLTTLRYFENEYIEHIRDKKCRAGVCKALIEFSIDDKKCTGCTLCARHCPVNAISGTTKTVHSINTLTCIKCGLCFEACKFNAVKKQ